MEQNNFETFRGKPFQEKFLGTLVYEFIRRTMYYTDFRLTSSAIKSMAHEFKTALNMDWFFPTNDWVEKFRSTYNLQDVNTKTLSIGYNEPRSTQMCIICSDLIPLSMATKMPQSILKLAKTPASIEATTNKLQLKNISKSPAVEVIEIIDDVENECPLKAIKEKLAVNGVKIFHKKIHSQDHFMKSSSCTNNHSAFEYHPVEKVEKADSPIDQVENRVSSAVCFVSNKSTEEQNNNDYQMNPQNVILADKTVMELPATIKLSPQPKVTTEIKRKAEKPPPDVHKKLNEEKNFNIKLPIVRNKSEPKYKSRKTTKNSILNRPLRTPKEALLCVNILEEFAMIRENFRLIGLIERLGKAIKKSI